MVLIMALISQLPQSSIDVCIDCCAGDTRVFQWIGRLGSYAQFLGDVSACEIPHAQRPGH